MPRVKNLLLHGASGSFKKEFVYRTYNNKTYLSPFPDMSKVKLSPAQRASNQRFAEAVAYAKKYLSDPEQKALLIQRMKNNKKLRDMTPQNVLIKEYMKEHSDKLSERAADKLVLLYLQKFQLSTRHQAALHYLLRFKTLSNAIYMSINEVSKPTATRDLKEMVNLGVIFCLGKGAGAKYQLKVIIAPEEIEKNPLTRELE